MLCPECGRPLREMCREVWINSKNEVVRSSIGHCEECDFDGTWDTDEDGNEFNFKQYFFG